MTNNKTRKTIKVVIFENLSSKSKKIALLNKCEYSSACWKLKGKVKSILMRLIIENITSAIWNCASFYKVTNIGKNKKKKK